MLKADATHVYCIRPICVPRNVHSKMFTVLSIDKDVYLESGTLWPAIKTAPDFHQIHSALSRLLLCRGLSSLGPKKTASSFFATHFHRACKWKKRIWIQKFIIKMMKHFMWIQKFVPFAFQFFFISSLFNLYLFIISIFFK